MQLEETESESIASEDIQARTYRQFTKVECLGVYAVETLSEPQKAPDEFSDRTKKIALHIRYPNNETAVISASPRYLCAEFDSFTREEILNGAINGDSFWVAEFSTLFETEVFPKMREYIIVQSKDGVDAVYDYKDRTLIDSDVNNSAITLSVISIIGLFGVATLLSVVSFMIISGLDTPQYTHLLSLAPLLIAMVTLHQDTMDAVFDKIEAWHPKISAPHLWLSEESWDVSEQENLSQVSQSASNLLRFMGSVTDNSTVTITNVDESQSSAELTVESEGEHFTVTMSMPYNLDADQPLANLVQGCGVGSVSMLENEKVGVEVSTIDSNVTGYPMRLVPP